MDEKLKNVIRLVSELQKAIKDCPDVLTSYVTKWEEDRPLLHLFDGNGVEFTEEKRHGNLMTKKFSIIDGVEVFTVYFDGDEK